MINTGYIIPCRDGSSEWQKESSSDRGFTIRTPAHSVGISTATFKIKKKRASDIYRRTGLPQVKMALNSLRLCAVLFVCRELC